MSVNQPFRFEKDPEETFDVAITFRNADPDVVYVIDSVDIKAYDSEEADVTADVVDDNLTEFTDNIAIAWVKGGTSGKTYKIEVVATMVGGQKLMKRLVMKVKT